MDPGTVLIIRFDDEPQLVREIVQELHIDARKLSFFPVNDVQDIAAPGGTHWSLLVLERGTRSFWHFDSIAGKNFKVAREISSRISEVLGLGEFRVQEHWTPQQKNSFDCGVFVVAIAEWIIRQLIEKQRNVFGEGREFVQAEMKEYFGARYIAQFRNVVRGRIEDIAASGTKSTRK